MADGSMFRDFGILPEGLQPPPDRLECFIPRGKIVGQYIGTAVVLIIGLGLAAVVALTMGFPLNLLACAAALVTFGAFVYLATHNDFYWMELEGDTLRARHLYTGWTVERSIGDIVSLTTIVYPVRQTATVVVEKLLGRVKGIDVWFRNVRSPLRILRADPAMTNAREMIEAILYRMQQQRELDAEVVTWVGQPLVRKVFWKGQEPKQPKAALARGLNVILICLMILGLLFGVILGYLGFAQKRLRELSSVPPQQLTLGDLVQNGPGANPHVTVSGFGPGGYLVEHPKSSTPSVYVALFPAGDRGREEIRAVLHTTAPSPQGFVQQLAREGRVTGICSQAPRSGWGTELGPKLTEANHGARLESAYDIEAVQEVPSEGAVAASLWGSAGLLAAVLVLGVVLLLKPV